MKIQAPPTIQFLLTDKRVRKSSPRQITSLCKDNGFLHDLEMTSTESLEHYHYIDAEDRPYSAELVPSPSGVDPLTGGVCQNLECRLAAATGFGRFAALYSDFSVLADIFSILPQTAGLESSYSTSKFVDDLMVLRQLEPLIKKGLLRFGTPKRHYCLDCGNKMKTKVQETAQAVTDLVAKDLKFQIVGDLLLIDMKNIVSQGGGWITELPEQSTGSIITESAKRAVGLDQFTELLETRLFRLLLQSISASKLKSIMLCSSELELLGLSEMDQNRPNVVALDS